MAVRLADVAKAAGVSQSTASRVLNGSTRRPKPEIADRVRAAAEELGYFPNAQAQALARSSAGLMGLIVHDIADPYFSSIARGAQRGLAGTGVQLMLASTEREAAAEIEAVRAFMSYRTDAILLAGSRGTQDDALLQKVLETYQDNGGKVAMIGQPFPSAGGVQIDNEGGAAALAAELLKLGHRRFAVLGGEAELSTSAQRSAGFLAKLKSAGVVPEVVREGTFTRDGGYFMMSELISSGVVASSSAPLCVFCVNDVMALGAMAAIRAAGLRVPDDVALAGFDDIPTLGDQFPSITTVRLPLEEIGRMTASMTLNNGEAERRMVVEGTPVLRDSTRLD
ncbi:LacI family DNA-binding transcriptional regulator [Nesterenkonia xinjiangensis]|uniref:LacI family transcriptional regulator n=1 Tax=Nesterenkonia xinjiangensis TaxID=225327 RepID=A0A7Z0GMY5_9MICC|nr:LacI family DNA-binding transcriptional regulator [Nesterenkonia xinjiangensis]NYJ77863.1 LacI family transcriptional regulator [Nesterenkonia xinjiangensis]